MQSLILANESIATRRRVYFDLRLAGVPVTSEAGGQPEISIDGSSWTNVGISPLQSMGYGRYFAEVSADLLEAGKVVLTRYKSNATDEVAGSCLQVLGINLAADAVAADIRKVNGGLVDGTEIINPVMHCDFLGTIGPTLLRSPEALQSATANTVTLHENSPPIPDLYVGTRLLIFDDSSALAIRTIIAYDGNTLTVTVDPPFSTIPTPGMMYAIFANGPVLLSAIKHRGSKVFLDESERTASRQQTDDALRAYGGLKPTVAGRTLDVADTGEVGLDFSNVKHATFPTLLQNVSMIEVLNVAGDVMGKVRQSVGGIRPRDIEQTSGGDIDRFVMQNSAWAIDGFYVGNRVAFLAGPASGAMHTITAYEGVSRVATVSPPFPAPPNPRDFYLVIADGASLLAPIPHPGVTIPTVTRVTETLGSSTDPLEHLVPGNYPQGSAGAALGKLLQGQIRVVGPTSADGSVIRLIRGDDYAASDGRQIEFHDVAGTWPGLEGAIVKFAGRFVTKRFDKEVTVVNPSGQGKSLALELSSDETSQFPIADHASFAIRASLGPGKEITLLRGKFIVEDDLFAEP